MQERLQVLANLVIVVAGTALCWVTFQTWSGPRQRNDHDLSPYKLRQQIQAPPGVNFAAAERSVLVFLRSTCRFCTNSMPFYRALVTKARAGNTVKVYVFSNEEEAETQGYLQRHSVSPTRILRTTGELAQRVRVTPTLVVVDRAGKVLHVGVGELGVAEQNRVATILF